MPEIKVTAEANLQPVVKELEQVQKELVQTATAAKAVNPAMQSVQSALAKTALSANALDSSLKKIVPGAQQGAQALQNVGRVAQDLPFGFIGIQNNLNPLLESFQRLKAETGSMGSALKALGSSLIGVGGVGLALSIVSSAIVIFQNGIAGFNSKTKEAADNSKKFAESLDKARESGIATGLQLQSFVDIAKDQTLSLGQRNEALEKANKILGDHGEKLTLVNIATAAVTKQIQAFTEATIQQALAEKFADRAAELIIKKRDAQKSYAESLKGVTVAQESLNRVANMRGQGVAGAAEILAQAEKRRADAQKRVSDIEKEELDIRNQLNEALKQTTNLFGGLGAKETKGIIANLRKQIKELTDAQPGLLSEEAISKNVAQVKVLETELDRLLGKTKAPKDIRTITDVLKELRGELDVLSTREVQLRTDETKAKISALDGAIKELITKFGVKGKDNTIQLFVEVRELQLLQSLRESLQTTVKGKELKIEPIITIDPVIKKGDFEDRMFNVEQFRERLKTFQQTVAAGLKEIETGALASIGDAIGNALSGKGDAIKGLFDSIFTSVGDQLQQLGKFLIKTGIEIKIAKEAFKKLLASPVAAIAVGIGLVALGALLKNAIANKPKGFASGSRSTPGGVFDVGERGPERIFLPQGSRVQPNNELQAFGGGGERIEVFGVMRGRDIYFSNKRTAESFGRQN